MYNIKKEHLSPSRLVEAMTDYKPLCGRKVVCAVRDSFPFNDVCYEKNDLVVVSGVDKETVEIEYLPTVLAKEPDELVYTTFGRPCMMPVTRFKKIFEVREEETDRLEEAIKQLEEVHKKMWDKLEILNSTLGKIADKYGVGIAQIPVAWAIAKGTLPIIGVTKVSHVEDAVKAANIALTADEVKELESVADSLGLNVVRMWEKEMK